MPLQQHSPLGHQILPLCEVIRSIWFKVLLYLTINLNNAYKQHDTRTTNTLLLLDVNGYNLTCGTTQIVITTISMALYFRYRTHGHIAWYFCTWLILWKIVFKSLQDIILLYCSMFCLTKPECETSLLRVMKCNIVVFNSLIRTI